MLNFFFQIFNGFTHSFLSVKTLFLLDKSFFKKILMLFFINFVLLYIPKYISLYYQTTLYTFLYNIYIYPMYFILYLFSLDKFNKILKVKNQSKNVYIQNNSLLYFKCLSLLYYILVSILFYIPYIGFYIGLIFACHSYGYYSLEYVCSLCKLTPLEKLSFIENNPYFFIGYGSILGLSLMYLPFIEQHLFFLMFFPITTIYLMENKNIYYKKPTEYNLGKVFIIPIYLLNFILNIITKYLNL